MNRHTRELLGWMLLLALPRAVEAAPKPTVVLISIDTLRSDRLPAYGYREGSTPAIDALVRDSLLFERAYSPVPLTLPAHLSLFTGRLPGDHGVRDNAGYRFVAGEDPYLPEVLRRAGYSTGGAVSSFVLRSETGFDQGFDFFEASIDPGVSEDLGAAQRPGEVTTARLLAWLEKPRSGPLFAFLHLYEPHSPYDPPSPFRERHRDRYDGEIAAADAQVGRFLDALRRLGLYDSSLIILLSDHGEGLGDHGEAEHGLLLYREAIQVPLVVKLPGKRRAGERVAEAVGLLDVFPTILEVIGIARPQGLPGLSLLARETARPPVVSETFYPRIHYGWSHLASAIDPPFHVIEGPDPEIYDLAADPAERKNLRDSQRRALHRLRNVAREAVAPFVEPAREDADTAEKLAALGYLSAGSATKATLEDPKAMLPLLARFREAVAAVADGRPHDAEPTLEAVVAESPGMTNAWLELGRARVELGRTEEGVVAMKRALETSGGAPHVALAVAQSLRAAGRLDEAREHAQLALDAQPAEAHSVLAGIAFSAKDYVAAEREARAALEAGGRRLAGLMLLAKTLIYQKRPQEALQAIETAEAELAALPQGVANAQGIYLIRGDVQLALGNPEGAFRAYEREMRQFPDNPLGYVSAALILGTSRRPAEAIQVLRALVSANPNAPAAYRWAGATLLRIGARSEAATVIRLGVQRFPNDADLLALSQGKPIALEVPPLF